jgi:hypothetical protein
MKIKLDNFEDTYEIIKQIGEEAYIFYYDTTTNSFIARPFSRRSKDTFIVQNIKLSKIQEIVKDKKIILINEYDVWED